MDVIDLSVTLSSFYAYFFVGLSFMYLEGFKLIIQFIHSFYVASQVDSHRVYPDFAS